jgi:hypothetical protein
MGYVDVQKLTHVLPDGRVLFDDVSFRLGEGAKTHWSARTAPARRRCCA